MSALFLSHCDSKLDIIVAGDISYYSIGAISLLKHKDSFVKAIADASRILLSAEMNSSQIEIRVLGIPFDVKKFHKFIHGRTITLLTDHHPLLSIFGSKKSILTHTGNRLQRWGIFLLNYNFKTDFPPSKKLSHADGLSKLIPKLCSSWV